MLIADYQGHLFGASVTIFFLKFEELHEPFLQAITVDYITIITFLKLLEDL